MENKSNKSYTVGELIDFLKQFNPDDVVNITRLKGFTEHIFPLLKEDVEHVNYSNSVNIDVTRYKIMIVNYE